MARKLLLALVASTAISVSPPSPPTSLLNRKEVGTGRVERTVPLGLGAEGFDVGMDNISAVSPD
jgi:hypothetical protein